MVIGAEGEKTAQTGTIDADDLRYCADVREDLVQIVDYVDGVRTNGTVIKMQTAT